MWKENISASHAGAMARDHSTPLSEEWLSEHGLSEGIIGIIDDPVMGPIGFELKPR